MKSTLSTSFYCYSSLLLFELSSKNYFNYSLSYSYQSLIINESWKKRLTYYLVFDLNIFENIDINSGVNSAAHSSVKLSSLTLVGKRSKIIAVKFLVLSQNLCSNPSSSAINLST